MAAERAVLTVGAARAAVGQRRGRYRPLRARIEQWRGRGLRRERAESARVRGQAAAAHLPAAPKATAQWACGWGQRPDGMTAGSGAAQSSSSPESAAAPRGFAAVSASALATATAALAVASAVLASNAAWLAVATTVLALTAAAWAVARAASAFAAAVLALRCSASRRGCAPTSAAAALSLLFATKTVATTRNAARASLSNCSKLY